MTYLVSISLSAAGADSDLTYFQGHHGGSRRNRGESENLCSGYLSLAFWCLLAPPRIPGPAQGSSMFSLHSVSTILG